MPALVRIVGRVKTPSDRLTVRVRLDTMERRVRTVRVLFIKAIYHEKVNIGRSLSDKATCMMFIIKRYTFPSRSQHITYKHETQIILKKTEHAM